MVDLSENIWERIQMLIDILFDLFIMIALLFGFYIIDLVLIYCGFEHNLISKMLHNFIHPVMMLSFFSISIMRIFNDYLPKPSPDSRFEFMYEDDENNE